MGIRFSIMEKWRTMEKFLIKSDSKNIGSPKICKDRTISTSNAVDDDDAVHNVRETVNRL